MTEVIYMPETMDIVVRGHSGSAEKGEDLVCAACSTLANTLKAVFQIQEAMQGYTSENAETARFHAWVDLATPLAAQAFVVMETIATGYEALAEQYPDYVSFKVVTEGGEEA